MRILNIHLKNINSLEGESRIHFDQAPIAEGGVFAITGPNGSGKTSILDAITLGLYGETYRFDKPAEHVMTKQAVESFAKVVFFVDGQTYQSEWRVQRADAAPQGKLLPAEMQLARLEAGTGEPIRLESGAQGVRQQIAQLTGMDFHRFTKSMMLAQGDFSAFLNALDSERLDILEKIAGGDIYAEYKARTEAEHAEAQNQLATIKRDIAALPLLDPISIEAGEQDLDDFKQQVEALQQQQAELEQQAAWLDNLKNGAKQCAELAARQQRQQQELDALQNQLVLAEASQPALPMQDDLAQLDRKAGQTEQSQTVLNNYRSELRMLEQQLLASGVDRATLSADKSVTEQKRAIDELKLRLAELRQALPREQELLKTNRLQLQEKQAALETVNVWLQEHGQEQVLIDDFPETGKLRKLRQDLAELVDKQKSYASWSKNTHTSIKKNQGTIKSLENSIAELKQLIVDEHKAVADQAQGHSLEQLAELRTEQLERVRDFRELLELGEVNARLTKTGFFGFFAKTKADEIVDEQKLLARADTLQMELAKEENIRKTLVQAITQEALLKKMQADRKKLVEGKPCPLCGSTKHPYVLRPPSVAANSKKALADQRGKIQAIKTAMDSINQQLAVARKTLKQRTEKEAKLQAIRTQWQSLANRLNTFSADMHIDNLALMKKRLKAEAEQFDKLDALVKKYVRTQSRQAKLTKEIELKQSTLEKLTARTQHLDAEWNNRPQELIDLEQAFAATKAEEKVLAAALEQQLAVLGEKLPTKGKEDALFDRLNFRRQEYQMRLLRKKSLTDEISQLQQQLQANEKAIADFNRSIELNGGRLQSEELAGLHLALTEKQKMIAEQEQTLAQQQLELNAMQQALAAKLAATPFADLSRLRDALALLQRQPQLAQQLDEQQRRQATLTTQLQQLQESLQQQQALALTFDTAEDLARQRAQIKERLSIAEQEVATLENKLRKQNDYREKQDALFAQLQSQQVVADRCAAEAAIVRDENTGPFRRKAQQVMVDRLLSQANRILEKISGRYYLRRADSEHGLALEIEDTRQKNSRRLPQTLSGGESFVVSLALALALAEIANNGKAIDSLFLDEGFGNLDAESLYLVISTLESLKNQGKIVGIISHVEGVRKRIKTQIELVKKPNGLSGTQQLAVVSSAG